jgi:hypothetical protein
LLEISSNMEVSNGKLAVVISGEINCDGMTYGPKSFLTTPNTISGNGKIVIFE